ncbi:transcription factor Ouib-like [Drosophila innubila]|uniref:transcription factor Ouib-like n=1 Tax=Drosophila innubila TaxID=198719 RepID=UPI00148D5267|nr:transcription factor Ouib-like [Drosophila innubila]
MSIQCRTCAAKIFNPTAKNLFEDDDDDEILQNIEILTGMRLKEDQNMPKHICTCCHLDLYHSMAFRDRCLRAENFLQSEKDKVKPEDSLNTNTIDYTLVERIYKTEPQSDIAKSKTKEQLIDKPIAKNLSQQSTQRRSPRSSIQSAKTPRQKLLNIKKKRPTAKTSPAKASPAKASPATASPAKASPVPKVDTDQKVAEPFSTSPRSTRDYCEDRRSTSSDELSNLSTGDVTSLFPEAELEKSLPNQTNTLTKKIDDDKQMPIEESLLKQHDESKNNNNEEKTKRIVKKESNAKSYFCDLCGHQSCSGPNLELHILRHKGEKNFECMECGEKHYSKYLLNLHVRVKHQGEKPYACKYCDQRFFSASERGRHEAVRHVRNFKYECKVCGKKYLTRSCLNKHEFLHTGLRPYKCDLCNVAFPRKPGLRIHCRTKQHQKRESEALNSQLNIVNEITIPDGSMVFPGTIIELVDA